jgi:O-methyltransferase/methyltransferase family protein
MNQASPQPSLALRRLVNGYQVTQAIHVAAVLGVADLLADGPRSSDDLAAATETDPGALYRLLRALASVGVFREQEDQFFDLTDLGACLRSDAPEPVGGWAAFVGEPYQWQAWSGLLHSVRTGENAFRHVHHIDSWSYRAQHPELSASFDHAMTSLSRQVVAAVLNAYDFGHFGRVVDVGGGNGAFLGPVLARYPAMYGILFDQPHVVSGAAPVLEAAGVADRCDVMGGSFFETVPAGGDAYILKAILHDWKDEPCLQILRTCRQAMAPGTALLVIERELGRPNEHPDAKFSDLNMLVGPMGQERTHAEYVALLTASGFKFEAVTPSAVGTNIISAVAA